MYISPDPIGLLGLFLLLAKKSGWGKSSTSAPASGQQLPPPSGELAQTSPGWPQVMPAGLPVFPGSGWEYDEPPPPSVQKRAQALVSTLWGKGSGAFKTELVGGRWITFRAEKVRSGKQGVVAYRVRIAKKPKPATSAQAPAAPAAPAMPAGTPVSTGAYVDVKQGHTYRWVVRVISDLKFEDLQIAEGLKKLDATKIVIDRGPPLVVSFTLRALISKRIYLNVRTGFPIGDKMVAGEMISIEEQLPEGILTSTEPAAAPGGAPAAAAPAQPLVLRDLKFGDGLAPAAPVEEVKIVQERLKVKPVDGRFGDGTRNAVIAFQVETGLAPKGVKLEELRKRGFGAVKRATWEKLFSVRA